ncbi:MAG: DNA-directed RNA polymerase subunit beta' [Anaerolineaceae bacterium 4572_32.1]|nr:MAG: DNA-directed RNA polymerase subunit beta' [Anaerolineaceae bacterium 4572_32.1]
MDLKDFNALRISLASPEQIISWSYGEVLKPETINYRRLRPEKDGLFCEAIFGPTKDWKCYCGKYKNIRYKGIICDKCGVEVTRASVRRERMGHIELAAPVAHLWYSRRTPNYLGLLLDIRRRDLNRTLYFAQYVITSVDEDARQRAMRRLDEEMEREQSRLQKATEEAIQDIEERRDKEVQALQAERDVLLEQLDQELNIKTENIMSKAKSLQARLERDTGKTVRKPVVFGLAETEVVAQGDTITQKHLAQLNEAVQARLSEIQAKVDDEKNRNLAIFEGQIADAQQLAAHESDTLRSKLAQKLETLSAAAETRLNELKNLAPMQFLSESQYRELRSRWGQVLKASMGAEAFHELLSNMDLDALRKELWDEIRHGRSKQRRKKAVKRLRVVEALRQSNNRPEWMIITVLPVIPPDLRPMVQLDGGRFATSDLNDLYRRVINRNNRLKRLLELGAPDVIVRNEKRMLQESVDSLIDNSRQGKARSRRGRRELKSLSDMLKGKKGRFRRNLLGKRVDYSGRSVIVIGPHLKMNQCGLPKSMALELYRPFVIAQLVKHNYANNVKGAKRIIERERQEVWEVLEEVIGDRPVLLNRAPTLHRLGIQAFEPILVEGKAIHLHPLVCAAFNADFDGDQMAVHVPLSKRAVEEARQLMLPTKNLLLPASGEPIVGPTKDMVMGCYYLTMEQDNCPDSRMVFNDIDEVELAHDLGKVKLHTPIRLANPYSIPLEKPPSEFIETTVGRAIFNAILPDQVRYVNETLDKKGLKQLIARCYNKTDMETTADVADKIKDIGFKYATRSGVSIAVGDLTIPQDKEQIIQETENMVHEVERQYRRGLLTEDEQYTRTIELWSRAKDDVTEVVANSLKPSGSIRIMAESGSTKGGYQPISQLAGMRGLMADPSGRIIPLPIISNFREGLSSLEYFISTHGARKGLADTALRTADAGYLTRRLVDVAQDIIINVHDCGTRGGIWIRKEDNVGGQTLAERVAGRVSAGKVIHPETGEILIDAGEMINDEQAKVLEKAGVTEVYTRSPMTCQLKQGICAKCYGRDLGRGKLVEIGTAVGIMAAQSIGEPGTQLTLRTFHTGGVAHGGDITHGLPRVEELFEARKHPKGEAELAGISGRLEIRREGEVRTARIIHTELMHDEYQVPGNWAVLVKDEQEVEEGAVIAKRGDKQMLAERSGRVVRDGYKITIVCELRDERLYKLPSSARLLAEDGAQVEAGQQLTEGTQNPLHILHILGREATQRYLMREVQKVYRSQGVTINDKHFEVIISKMLNKVQVTAPGDTELLPGVLTNRIEFAEANEVVTANGGQPARAIPVLMGITKAALNTESFLSAASFQHTIKVLAQAAIAGKKDALLGLKENVILGKRIPAGTGFRQPPGNEKMIIPDSFEGIPLAIKRDKALSLPSLEKAVEGQEPEAELEMIKALSSSDAGSGK